MAVALGIDFGTNSVRVLLVDASNGRELASCVVDYPSGKQGILLDPRDTKGGYVDFYSAQQAMTSLKPVSYSPKPENQAIYNRLYVLYRQLHDAFGGISKCADLFGVMKELIHIKEEQTR